MNDNIYADIILDYINHGFSPIPVPYKTKAPITKEWNKLELTANNYQSYFDGTATNIAILTGKRSGGLVDVDVDSIDALKFAPWFLPKTNCVFGRKSMPKSHWLYRVPNMRRRNTFAADGVMMLELRGNGCCTIFPGSVHPSGETVEFENPNDYAPSSSTWKKLKQAGRQIVIATELYKTWSPGIRHELTLSTAAMLLRKGWTIEEVTDLIKAVANEARDDEVEDRLVAVETTFAKYAKGEAISGNERLIEILGPATAENIRKWACTPEVLKLIGPLLPPANANPLAPALTDLSNESGTLMLCGGIQQ